MNINEALGSDEIQSEATVRPLKWGAWGHCPTCHLTFPQQAFDRHRVGKFENQAIGQENTRRCLTGDEMREAGWKYDAEAGIWRTPDPKPKDAA